MAFHFLDYKGLRCPQPRIKVTIASMNMKQGDVLEVVADCFTFEEDMRNWCLQLGYTLIWCKDEGEKVRRVRIQL
jgi:tRNA 2-thiouridine synthesizing protein A